MFSTTTLLATSLVAASTATGFYMPHGGGDQHDMSPTAKPSSRLLAPTATNIPRADANHAPTTDAYGVDFVAGISTASSVTSLGRMATSANAAIRRSLRWVAFGTEAKTNEQWTFLSATQVSRALSKDIAAAFPQYTLPTADNAVEVWHKTLGAVTDGDQPVASNRATVSNLTLTAPLVGSELHIAFEFRVTLPSGAAFGGMPLSTLSSRSAHVRACEHAIDTAAYAHTKRVIEWALVAEEQYYMFALLLLLHAVPMAISLYALLFWVDWKVIFSGDAETAGATVNADGYAKLATSEYNGSSIVVIDAEDDEVKDLGVDLLCDGFVAFDVGNASNGGYVAVPTTEMS